MDATPLLARILAALQEHRLEAVLIGNAAAAMHGAPVTAARNIAGLPLRVASLDDIIASKKAAGRDRDKAVLPILEKTLKSMRRRQP